MIEHLANQERWDYISDAGTPGVSDPGAKLVNEVQKAGYRVIPIPGASAVSTAISVGGSTLLNSAGQFQFLGFWPNKSKDRAALIQEIIASSKTSIFFESPHHIRETLLTLHAELPAGRQLVIGRELTKKFEQVSTLYSESLPHWLEHTESLKGEFIVLIAGRKVNSEEASDHATLLQWANALNPYLGSKEIAAVLSQVLGVSKKEAYQVALDAK